MKHSRRDCPGRGCSQHRWPPGDQSLAARRRHRGMTTSRRPVNPYTMTAVELKAAFLGWGMPPADAARCARELRADAVEEIRMADLLEFDSVVEYRAWKIRRAAAAEVTR